MRLLPFSPPFSRQQRFNLVELLLVMVVILTLSSLLIPSLKRTSDLSKQIICKNQLRKVSRGFAFFILDHNQHLPYANWSNNRQRATRGWNDFIQPYLSTSPQTQQEFDQLKMPVQKGIAELQCPSSRVGPFQEDSKGLSNNFQMPSKAWKGEQNLFIGNSTTGFQSKEPSHRSIHEVDEQENTLLLAEMDVDAFIAIQGLGGMVLSPLKQVHETSNGVTFNARANHALDLHPNQALNYLFVDGHVEAQNHDAPSLVGQGDLKFPGGAWTVQAND